MASDGDYSGFSSSDDPLVNAMPTAMRSDIDNIRADYQRFDYSRYPHPLPLLGPLFGFNEGRVRKMVVAEWAWARRTLQRQLNDGEEDALAGAATKQMRIMSYAGPIGASLGLYRAYATRETWRMPFWAMSPTFDPNYIRFGSRELVAGEAAKTFWRVVRNGLYGANGVVFSMCIFASFSASSVSVAIAKDPRLQQFAEAIKQTAAKARETRMQRTRRPPVGQDPTGQGQRSTGELWKEHRTSIEGSNYNQDSPSGGNYVFPETQSAGNYSQDNDASPSSRPAWQQPQTSAPARRSPPAEQRIDDSFIDDWDDASPQAPPAGSRPRQTSRGSGSAWDRVRREAADGPKDSPTARDSSAPREARGANAGYTFSSKDEDRQLARGEAQKDFDARLERERQGGDFNEGRGQRKW